MTIATAAPPAIRSMGRNSSRETCIRYLPIIESFVDQYGKRSINGIKARDIEDFVLADDASPSTARVRAAAISWIFSEAIRNDECQSNPVRKARLPKPEAPTIEPFTDDEILAIMDAAGTDREFAMVGLLFSTGLRIRDIVTLERAAVRYGEIRLRARKNGREIRLPIPPTTQLALDRLPHFSERYFFWTGQSSIRTAVRNAQRSLEKVFAEAEVENAHPHRARHTMATKILSAPGSTMQDVADVLGITIAVAERRYAKWSPERHKRISNTVRNTWV